LDINLLIMVW